MSKNKEIEEKDLEQTVNPDVLKQIIADSFQNVSSLGDTAKDLETAKIILSIILDKNNIASTTNLDVEQIEDIANAEMVNVVMKNPLIDAYINSFRVHRRSLTDKPNNLLQILSDIVGKGHLMDENRGILDTIGNRFKR